MKFDTCNLSVNKWQNVKTLELNAKSWETVKFNKKCRNVSLIHFLGSERRFSAESDLFEFYWIRRQIRLRGAMAPLNLYDSISLSKNLISNLIFKSYFFQNQVEIPFLHIFFFGVFEKSHLCVDRLAFAVKSKKQSFDEVPPSEHDLIFWQWSIPSPKCVWNQKQEKLLVLHIRSLTVLFTF